MIYADNAATTKISNLALEKMLPFLQDQYGNASSQYSIGVRAKRAVEQARRQIAAAIGAQPPEIVFTSSGSESNNWVLRNIADSYRGQAIHFITSSIEHYSVLNACQALEATGAELTYLPVDNYGRISVDDVKKAVKANTRLVTFMLANNEIGTIQPIAEIGSFLSERGIIFHTDAVQAVGHIPVNINDLHVDLLTASAHKFNGAKGTGILYKKSGLRLLPFIFGGAQEQGHRAGTENVAGIVAAGYALEESIATMGETTERLKAMIDATVNAIRERIPCARVNGDPENRLPGTVNLRFDGVSGESLMHLLDLKGICISTSSACTSGKEEPSHVLIALGLTEQQAKESIRISYGRHNTLEETKAIAGAICDAYDRIRAAK